MSNNKVRTGTMKSGFCFILADWSKGILGFDFLTMYDHQGGRGLSLFSIWINTATWKVYYLELFGKEVIGQRT